MNGIPDAAWAWIAAGALLLYAYGLGSASVMVWRLYKGPVRYAPAVTTLLYYWAALSAHPPAFIALQNHTLYAVGDALRTITSAAAFGVSLLLLALLARRKR